MRKDQLIHHAGNWLAAVALASATAACKPTTNNGGQQIEVVVIRRADTQTRPPEEWRAYCTAMINGKIDCLNLSAPIAAARKEKIALAIEQGIPDLVLGPPSLTAEQIDEILERYGSPAQGVGEISVSLSMEYCIDVAYLLGFFRHESTFGTAPNWAGLKPGGLTTHNVGNITCAGYATCAGRFRDYPNWEEGIRDWFRLILEEYVAGRGTITLEEIIPIYAPKADRNNPDAYVKAVRGYIQEWRGQKNQPGETWENEARRNMNGPMARSRTQQFNPTQREQTYYKFSRSQRDRRPTYHSRSRRRL